MAPGRNSYRMAAPVFDTRARRISKARWPRAVGWGIGLLASLMLWGVMIVLVVAVWKVMS